MASGGAVDEKKRPEIFFGWYGVIASIAGIILYIGNFQANTLNSERDHERRIESLEADNKGTIPALAEIRAAVQYLKEREQERSGRER